MKQPYHISQYLVAATLLIVGFISCSNGEYKESDTSPKFEREFAPTGNNGEYNNATSFNPIPIERFDQTLPIYIYENDTVATAKFREQYNPFFPIYCQRILGLGDAPTYQEGLKTFITHEAIAQLYDDTQSRFSADSAWVGQLQTAFTHYAKLFSGEQLPRILTHISGLNQSIVTVDTILSISLDCYLGVDYPLYAQRYYEYERPLHTPDRIAIDAAEVWLRTQYPYQSKRNALLDRMVYEGKILIALTQLFPESDVFQLLGYTPQQALWCRANESEAWRQIVSKKHLFNTETMLIFKYIEPAPFVSALHKEAPGKFGRWMGYQIVSEYLRHQSATVQELLDATDNADNILKESKYNK